MKQSRLFEGYFYRYQQLYMGIPVVNGGFSILVETGNPDAIPGPCNECPPGGPCGLITALAPHIYEVMGAAPTVPTITEQSISNHLPYPVNEVAIKSSKLKIVGNIKRDCEYRLAWQIDYTRQSEGEFIGWLDAQTGELLFNKHKHDYKNAPTTDWGVQWMDDEEDGNNTVLRNERLVAYDMTGVAEFFTSDLGDDFDSDQIPESPTNRDWNNTDAPEDVFQAFWMTDQVIETYQTELDIGFSDVHIGVHPTATGATSFGPAIPSEKSTYVFGLINGDPTIEYDVIGHELGHTVIREYFSSGMIEGGSLHEGIADMLGTYIEAELNGLDWQMGDDIPFIVRDLQGTTRNCFTTIATLTSEHDRSEALGHWFFLCVNGDAANNIPAMNIDEVMDLVLEAMPNLGDNPDYPDLMNATMDLAESVYGTCSDQFLTILRAWEQICVNTGHRMVDPNEPCAILANAGTNFPCEENDFFSICLSSNSGLNTNQGNWKIIGRESVYFESTAGMQGNSQTGGSCITITEIPEMPYYPQDITIQYWNSEVGQTITHRITIRDCDGDDPTCEEYYGIEGLAKGDGLLKEIASKKEAENQSLEEGITDSPLHVIAYDLMGNKLDIPNERLIWRQGAEPKIIILTYWDDEGKLVKSEKTLLY